MSGILFKNKVGVKVLILNLSVTTSGGGTYLTRAIKARNETDADVIIFNVPKSINADKIVGRIKRGHDDLRMSVKPLILPFKIVTHIGETINSLKQLYAEAYWSDVKY